MNADDVTKILNQLAEKLTPPAQHVWDLAMRQMIVTKGLAAIVGTLLLIIATIMAFKVYHWAQKTDIKNKEKEYDGYHSYDQFDVWFPASLILIGCTLPLILGIMAIYSALPTLLNPEWAVLMQIKDLVP